jgi:hypothetical protein
LSEGAPPIRAAGRFGDPECHPARHESRDYEPAGDRLARGLFALLVLACFAAFFITQRLKHTPTPVQRFERTPTFEPRSPQPERRLEQISFKLARAERVTVTIVDSNLSTVATLVSDYPLPRYKQFSLRWNGRRGSARTSLVTFRANGHRIVLPRTRGALAPAGEYRVRVTLLGKNGREIYSPWSFTLEGR